MADKILKSITFPNLPDKYVIPETQIDSTLSKSGQAADAKETGDRIDSLKNDIESIADISRNLYNPNTDSLGKVINASGEIVDNNNYRISDYIEIPDIGIVVPFLDQTSAIVGRFYQCSFFDENKAFLSRTDAKASDESGVKTFSRANVSGKARYIRLARPLGANFNVPIMVNAGTELLEYREYNDNRIKDSAQSKSFDLMRYDVDENRYKASLIAEYSGNLYNKATDTLGVVILADGTINESTSYRTSDFIEIPHDGLIMPWLEDGITIGKFYICAYYDKDKQFIKRDAAKNGSSTLYVLGDTAKYVRLCRLWNNGSAIYDTDLMVNRGNTLKEFAPYGYAKIKRGTESSAFDELSTAVSEHISESGKAIQKINDTIIKSENLYNADTDLLGYVIKTNGEFLESNDYRASDFIEIPEDGAIMPFIDGNSSVGKFVTCSFYNADKEFMWRKEVKEESGTYIALRNYATGKTAKYIRLCRFWDSGRDIYNVGIMVNHGSVLYDYVPFGEYYLSDIAESLYVRELKDIVPSPDELINKYLSQKTLFDGTYIFGEGINMDYPVTGIPALNLPVAAERPAYFYGLFDGLVASYPDYVTKIDCDVDAGITQPSYMEDYPIYLYSFIPPYTPKSSGGDTIDTAGKKIKVMIIGGTHPEYTAIDDLYHTMRLICEKWQDDDNLFALRWTPEFYVFPCEGCYGVANISRTNYNGVDLNRNMPTSDWRENTPGTNTYSGPTAGSEYESQILVHYIDSINPDIVIDHHNTSSATPQTLMYITSRFQSGVDIGAKHIQEMSNRWKKRYPENFSGFMGDIYGFAQSTQEFGTRGGYACEHGALGFTFESQQYLYYMGDEFVDTAHAEHYTAKVETIATDGFLNFLLLAIKIYCRIKLNAKLT